MTQPRLNLIPLLLLLASAAPAAAQRPWLTTAVWGSDDDQPRTALHGRLDAGRYFGPNATLAISFEAVRLTAERVTGTPTSFSQTTTRPGLAGSIGFPAARLGLAAEVSSLFGSPSPNGLVLWNIRPSLQLGGGVALRARVDRDRYTATAASLDTTVLSTGYELALDRSEAPGWAGAARYRRDDYGDNNPVTTISFWILAPLTRSATHSFRAGYAFGWQDAAESRWVPRNPGGGAPPAGGLVAGHYDPYYTPHDVRVHSLAADAAIAAGPAWFTLNGAVAVHARELASEYLTPTGGPTPVLTFTERAFRPWQTTAAFSVPLASATWLALSGNYQRTAFWTMVGARVSLAQSF
jgi:hypothetical protein